MDNNGSSGVRDTTSLGIFKTIYLFLVNHNLNTSADIFKNESGLYRVIDKIPSKSLLLRKCRCSKNVANQTDQHSIGAKSDDACLVGTYEGEALQVKDNETHVFYVCDHSQIVDINERKEESENKKDKMHEEHTTKPEDFASKSELIKLISKFDDLQGEHKKLITVTTELTSALQMNIIGQTKNIYSVLEHCKSIYPSLFSASSPRPLVVEENLDRRDKSQELFPNNVMKRDNFNRYEENMRMEGKIEEKQSRIEEKQPKKEGKQSHHTETEVQFCERIDPLNLENLRSLSPLKTPVTPETVRHILDTILERIYELEKSRDNGDTISPILKKDELDRIVTEVFENLTKPAQSVYMGGGEGEASGPESLRELCVVMRTNEGDTFFDVDYGKIKRDLIHSDSEKRIRILQALRWRITKNDNPIREKVMESYVTNDVLDLSAGISLAEKILMAYTTDPYVQESTCRLINTLASLRQGRDYLTQDDRVLKRVLIKKMKDIKNVTSAVIRNMLVASIQKLSIRKQCRCLMVQEGLFEVLLDYLDEFHDKLSRYCVEYCSALWMNLCLVEDAKARSTKNPVKVIGLIRKFLEAENECCLPYINGVMFSLLEKEEIVNEAKNQNLDKLLIRLIRITNNENIRKQLDFIVQSRLFGKGDTTDVDDDEENRDEVDLLEIELDQDDFITPLPSGEKLLEEYKRGKSPIRKEPTCSANSFSEENKQFFYKPSSERGVFEATKPRRYTTCSQNMMRNQKNRNQRNRSCGRYPATPLCYMENCQRLQDGADAPCTCTKCVPGQNRYSCGCYEAIRREIGDAGNEKSNYEMYPSHLDFRRDVKSRW